MLRAALRGNITLVCDILEDVWPIVVDAAQFELALLNVTLRARDAMPRGGVFTLASRNVSGAAKSELELADDFIEFTMSDTGDSVPEDALPHVFEPFFPAREGAKDAYLDLSHVRRFAEQAGGTATIKARAGIGMEIVLCLPRSLARLPMADAPLDAGGPEMAVKRILLVEDDADVAEVTQAMLTGLGYEVREASNAIDALEILTSNENFDVVLSDIIMAGGMSGVELARSIKSTFPDIRCLLMSGHGEVGEDSWSEFPMLRKPFKSANLREALDDIQHGVS
jgi:two-component system NtrC family sensor kinase